MALFNNFRKCFENLTHAWNHSWKHKGVVKFDF